MSKEVFCDKCYKGGSGICYRKIVLCPLHAAAGELLKAAKNMLSMIKDYYHLDGTSEFKDLEAAIKKASS